jgi:D-alanyl-lipoteichoic acid acyltransferase DltB (MBOAT superfamily)
VLFNSLEFAVFLPVVFLLYWFAFNRNLRFQNIFLLLASYFFYGWWDWRFLFLLISVSFFNYLTGIKIGSVSDGKGARIWLLIGIIVNVGILAVFKYFNFFIDSFADLLSLFGYKPGRSGLNIILPLGISFYTFLSLSYILDIYKKNLAADRNIIHVLLSLSFFPIILAGPIQRPSTLLPQIREKRKFQYDVAVDGLRQILWGLFVKIAVADNLAPYVDDIFLNFTGYSGSTLAVGALLYTLQIYADFSGYSHIAIGTARLFGFNLMQNFNYPYFSRDITEFWRRWHISLTSWFRDYIFLPISFAVTGRVETEKVFFIRTDLFVYIVASAVTWFLTGLWHGANYTFIVWGMINGLFLVIYQWQRKPRKRILKRFGLNNNNTILVVSEGFLTFLLVVLSWVIFRSDSLNKSFEYLGGIFSDTLFSSPQVLPLREIIITLAFVTAEYIQRRKPHALQIDKINSRLLRWAIYIGVVFIIMLFGGGSQKFIYFQF